MLASITKDNHSIPQTLLYNEGFLLLLILRALAFLGIDCLPFQFEEKAVWFSEANLDSAFDAKTEGFTRADAVVGHCTIRPGSKRGIVLHPDCSLFMGLEAKLF